MKIESRKHAKAYSVWANSFVKIGKAAAVAFVMGSVAMPAYASSTTPVATEVKIPTVTATEAVTKEIIEQTYASGTLVARDEMLVYPQINGLPIETLTARLGVHVSSGEVLATLSTDNLRVQLSQARAEVARAEASARQAENQILTAQAALTQAKAQLDRTERLKNSGSATQANLDGAIAQAQTAEAALASANDGIAVAHANLSQAKAGLELAELNLDRAKITAPVSGIISAKNGQIGGIATSAGEPLYRIIAHGVVDAELDLIASALEKIKQDDPVTLKISSIGEVKGIVRWISPTVDPQTRLATVTVELPDHPQLRPGLFAEGIIQTDVRNSIAAPTTAVLNDGTEDYVLSIQDGVIKRKKVEAGTVWNGLREIVSGLVEGEVLVTRAGAFFSDGDQVQILPSSAADATGNTSNMKVK